MSWPRLTMVIGKGGSGKSAVTAALALALARTRPTLLACLDRRCSAARLLEVEWKAGETVDAGPNLTVCKLGARRELERFIQRIVPMAALSRRLLTSHTFGLVAAALPGLEDFVLLHRLGMLAWEAARDDRYVVVDGLSTGNSLALLSVAGAMRKLASIGTLNRLALDLEGFLADSNRFGAAVVIRPQAMAVKEGLEAAAELRERYRVGSVTAILNMVAPPLFVPADLKAVDRLRPEDAELLKRRHETETAAHRARRELYAAGFSALELPMLFTADFGRTQIARLARDCAARVDA